MQRFERLPAPLLRPYVDRYWGMRSGAQPVALPILLPGAGAELYIHYGAPFQRIEREVAVPLGPAQLLCVRERPVFLAEQDHLGFVAVRFRAGALARFTRVPPASAADAALAPDSLWGSEGARWVARVREANTFDERCALLDEFLLARLAEAEPDPLAERAVRWIYEQHQHVSIERAAERFGLQRRQFERRVRTAFGTSPVTLRRLARFFHVARQLVLTPASSSLEQALAAGYFDQAHFIREFTRFSGFTPEAFRRAASGRTHFYNPPRSSVSMSQGDEHIDRPVRGTARAPRTRFGDAESARGPARAHRVRTR